MGTMPNVSRVLLCRPDYFDVEYIINPHMQPHSVDHTLATQQWQNMVDALEQLGIHVDIINQAPGVPDMVFATDQGIARDGKFLLANFRYGQRKKERPYYKEWFQDHGFEIETLSNVYPFEGGDTLFFGDMLLVGTGFRASVSSCEELSRALNMDVFPIRLVDPNYYHLDMSFLPIDSDTAFYYPAAYSKNSRSILQRLVKNLHELSQEEVEAYAANSFVSGDNIVVQAGIPSFNKKVEALGKKVIEVDVSEFNKAGGGIHCMINTLAFEGEKEIK